VLDAAVDALYGYGLVPVVAAGNDGIDACRASPAAGPASVTVASTTVFDTLSYFSNRGECVTLNAPGHDIVAAFPNTAAGTAGLEALSGTSMASPHVAGVLAT